MGKFYYMALVTGMVCLLTASARAQYNDTIQADRPGITISAYTVGKNVLQLEHGVEFDDALEDTATINLYTTEHILRYGLTDRVEVSALFEYGTQYLKPPHSEEHSSGIRSLQFGFRVHLWEEKKWRPATIFQLRLAMPHIGEAFGTSYVAPEMSLSTQYSLPKDLTLGTTWVLAWDGDSPAPLGQYAINFGFPIVGGLQGFVENYGQLQQCQFETRVDAGLAYIIGRNLQLDVSGGYGRNSGVTDFFVSTGIAWRVRFKEPRG